MMLLTKGIIHLRLGSFCQLSRPCAVDGSMIDGWDKRSTTNDTSGWLQLVGGWTNSFEKYARLNWIILPGTLNVIHNVPRKRSLSLSLEWFVCSNYPEKEKIHQQILHKVCTRTSAAVATSTLHSLAAQLQTTNSLVSFKCSPQHV